MKVSKSVPVLPALLGLLLLGSSPAWSNDTMAAMAAGGLQFAQSDAVSMESEDLTISPKQVRIQYEFKNHSDHDIETLVAFPLPKVDSALVGDLVDVNFQNPNNFVDFKVWVNDVPVPPQQELHAFANSVDIDAELKALKLPLSPFDQSFAEKVKPLSHDTLMSLNKKRILEYYADGDTPLWDSFYPIWQFQATYFWKQKFPAGQTVRIRHQYTPVVGHSAFFADNIAKERKAFCISPAQESEIKALFPTTGKANTRLLLRDDIDYILSTGAHWKGPIKRLTLTVEAPQHTKLPVLFCQPGSLNQPGVNGKAITLQNFTPHSELKIMLLKPETTSTSAP